MTVVTRFAPSPTGYLHIGGVRTALFNYLYAKHMGGKFLLRIEDTDRERSVPEAIEAITQGLRWIGLQWDGEPVFQFARADRHRTAAEKLLAEGKAYRCYATPEELTAMREEQKAKGLQIRYDGRWRDRDAKDAPAGVKPSIRMKAPQDGETVIHDLVQGPVTVANAQLDDMVLLRGDGTPTYMLAVVVDDIDMGITHVIRGDDHLNNAFRQLQLIRALGHPAPQYAHIPLIHGADGAKLSKRHGAVGVEFYRDKGFLPEALRNYLVRLGWSHGDDEIISDAQAIAWFDIVDVNRGAARFDIEKLTSLNGNYIRQSSDQRLVDLILPQLNSLLPAPLTAQQRQWLLAAMPELKQRAKTLIELADSAKAYVTAPTDFEPKALQLLVAPGAAPFATSTADFTSSTVWSAETPDPQAIEAWAREYAGQKGVKLGELMGQFRAALTGRTVSTSVFHMIPVLGKEEVKNRFQNALNKAGSPGYVVIEPLLPKKTDG